MEGPRISKEKLVPIRAETESVSYLGVELPKAANAENAPKPEQYADYINDEFALELQKKIAVSWKQGDPILIEAGTSVGKTTAVRKMCADLGYEVHYVNLNGATDIEDLMGRYIPNRDRQASTDPEYVFADGKVTSGLRQEEGKIKVILLDEYNAAAPNILIRLHEVLDALERGGEVVLSEDASEKIQVEKSTTKVVGLMNPPGRGYLQREPLDPAQIRRWVYQKEASELPKESFQHAVRAQFGFGEPTIPMPEEAYLFAGEAALTPDQLREIPGIEDMLSKYAEFHEAAKELIGNRLVAADQPQKFTFDDRMELNRVTSFIATFYRGDLNRTMQDALRYYYAGKLLERADKEKLEELIRVVEYVPPQNSRRKGLEQPLEAGGQDEEDGAETDAERGAARGEAAGLADAERIMGRENLLGPADVEKVFGIKLDRVPDVPFTKAELERAKELGQQLILQVDEMLVTERSGMLSRKSESVGPLTLENLKKRFEKAHDDGRVFWDQDWYEGEYFFKNEKPRFGWKLTSKEVIPYSVSENYLGQTASIATYLEHEVFDSGKMSPDYEAAISEFNRERDKIERLMDSDWEKASEALADLKITKLTRELPVEVMYRLILQEGARSERLLSSMYTWTARRASDGEFVLVGEFDSEGAYVLSYRPDYTHDALGVCFSRMK